MSKRDGIISKGREIRAKFKARPTSIEEALKTRPEEFHITNDERITLIEVLSFISCALKQGQLKFDSAGSQTTNAQYGEFCECIARRFANMPVQEIQ